MAKSLADKALSKQACELLAQALISAAQKDKKAQKKLIKAVQKISDKKEAEIALVLKDSSKKEAILKLSLESQVFTPAKNTQSLKEASSGLKVKQGADFLTKSSCPCCKKRCPLKNPKCSKGKKFRAAQLRKVISQSAQRAN